MITGMDLTHPVTPYPLQQNSDFLKDIFQFRKFPGKEPLFSESLKLCRFQSVPFACEHDPSRFSKAGKMLLLIIQQDPLLSRKSGPLKHRYRDSSKCFTLFSISCKSVRQLLCLHPSSEVIFALKYRSQPSKLEFAVG